VNAADGVNHVSSEFQLIAVGWPGSASVAIAASRANAVGILHLEDSREANATAQLLEQLSRLGRNQIGVALDASKPEFAREILPELPPISHLLLRAGDPAETQQIVSIARQRRLTILLEAVCVEEAHLGELLGVDGLIAKGNESGGRVGEETTFVLLQRILKTTRLPVFAQGGIGLRSAVACFAAGAAGAVLDSQLLLTRESGLPAPVQETVSRLDGGETVCLGSDLNCRYRVFSQPGSEAIEELRRMEQTLADTSEWRRLIESRIGWDNPRDQVWPLGQDAAFAASLAARFRTVGGVIRAIRDAVHEHAHAEPVAFGEGSPMSRFLGTRYPILQGPMTRVSDNPAFAAEVAKSGGLPFLALALLKGPEVTELLRQTRECLGTRPWGIGILGFVPPELRDEQMTAARAMRPPFALIAGGRPDQAANLEAAGIPTFLHVPSPGLLKLFLESGARRFVFEGRECGGHIGPRSSFVLWESAIEVLLNSPHVSDCDVVFAGGIHDALSSAMSAAMAAPLFERGARVGVLAGTAYVLTQEAVTTGAIVPGFQRESLNCSGTILLESGAGHVTRCADTPFARRFREEKQILRRRNVSAEEMRDALEQINLGRLRIASKGIARKPAPAGESGDSKYIALTEEEQHAEGLYMLGQVAALHDTVRTIRELHEDIGPGSCQVLKDARRRLMGSSPAGKPCDLAIVGMSCLLPGAADLQTYWNNILAKVSAVMEIPADRWDYTRYFNPDPSARDKIYSKWGGFLDDLVFEPLRYGIPPSAMSSIEPLQLLALELVRKALEDAGYGNGPSSPQRTSVIFGAGGGIADLGSRYAIRAWLPELMQDAPESVLSKLPEWTEDSFAGILLNVVAGRVANRFGFGGVNFTVDAACASSLAALYSAAQELETRSSDVVIVGGVDTVQNPFGYLCFSKTRALSPRGQCSTFDASADGIVISEGLAAIVLKRLADAEAEGDRIYAVIKGIGGSSDGRARGLTAPSPQGQASALKRAYEKAGFSPASVRLIEAHGTGTVAGDAAEMESLTAVLEGAGASPQSCAIGSVKSMIGHTKCAAGMAGLIKVALSLHRKVLPPTANVSAPNSRASNPDGVLYVNSEARPWVETFDHPRRAGVSSFGFGGTNFHAVLEEYRGGYLPEVDSIASRTNPVQLLLWRADSAVALASELRAADQLLAEGGPLIEAAAALWKKAKATERHGRLRPMWNLALVASSRKEAQEQVASVLRELSTGQTEYHNETAGIHFGPSQNMKGQVAFLFPGQGSQYPGMLAGLAMAFPTVRLAFEDADRILAGKFHRSLSEFVFPPPGFTEAEQKAARRVLMQTNVAQPALGAAGAGLSKLLGDFGIEPDFAGGHSYGEFVALHAAGVLSRDTLYRLSEARGRLILEEAGSDTGKMAAVAADYDRVAAAIGSCKGVWIANRNAPLQTVISGSSAGIDCALQMLETAGLATTRIATACGFHSPVVAPAADRLAGILNVAELYSPKLKVFSNTTGGLHSDEPARIAAAMADHLVKPVEFVREIETMYEMGARIFVEVGPNRVLTALTDQILKGRPHRAIACDRPDRTGTTQLFHALAELWAVGADLKLDELYISRQIVREAPSKSAWLVNGSRSVALSGTGATTQKRDREAAKSSPSSRNVIPEASRVPAVNSANVHGEDTLVRFQRTMQKFLETQQAALAIFHNRSSSAAAGPIEVPTVVPPPAAEPLPDEVSSTRLPVSDRAEEVVLRVVSERTGYEVNALRLDADLEADLGIDSIKRTEIASALQAEFLPRGARSETGIVDGLTRVKTLRGWVQAFETVEAKRCDTTPTPAPAGKTEEDRKDLQRFVPRMAKHQGTQFDKPIRPGDLFLITDDGEGVADLVAMQIRQAGGCVALCRMGAGAGETAPGLYVADLAEEASMRTAAEVIEKRQGKPRGALHLFPLGPVGGRDAMKSLFHFSKAAARIEPPRIFLTASREKAGDLYPGCGAMTGFVKSVSKEWEECRSRSVSFDAGVTPAEAAEFIVREIGIYDRDVEVAYKKGQRFVPRTVPQQADKGQRDSRLLEPESVVLLTGGARGITAEIALELAAAYQPTLILVGSSPAPAGSEPPEIAALTTKKEILPAVFDMLRRAGEPTTPAAAQAACARILKEREIRTNLKLLRESGAKVQYHELDVRDGQAIERLLERIYVEHGRLDGVVHGAGIIEDKPLNSKSSESFNRVFDTKVQSAITLARCLKPESLRFLALFSSVSGMFGNQGQSDYAAANAALNELARRLNSEWPGRVVAFNWGPWNGKGMVAEGVARQFEHRGVELISVERGRYAFHAELRSGGKEHPEVIYGHGPWANPETHEADRLEPATPEVPLVAAVARNTDGVFQFDHLLDPSEHPYLDDHRLDGRAVLPAAMAAELMAEVAAKASPGWQVHRIRSFRVLQGIILTNESAAIRIGAKQVSINAQRLELEMTIQAHDARHLSYGAIVELTKVLPDAPVFELPPNGWVKAHEVTATRAYRDFLFHGPRFQCLQGLIAVEREGCLAQVGASSPVRCLASPRAASWVIDPVVLDAGPQLAIVWARTIWDATALPSHFDSLVRYGVLAPDQPLACRFHVTESSGEHSVVSDVDFVDQNNRLMLSIRGLRSTCSKGLNRLVASAAPQFHSSLPV
jgi:acyl transferase domain-containing protein/NAD(P)H-dependent flavin oxidoreductase YrpB (nitropropane dioxygenase family)